MGAAAAALADLIIVTDDNPRSEEPQSIRRAILEGAPRALEIGDRRAAIRAGAEQLRDGDVLVVAGKGHEHGQIVGATILPFDDVAETAAALGGVHACAALDRRRDRPRHRRRPAGRSLRRRGRLHR